MKNYVSALIFVFWAGLAVSQEVHPTGDLSEVKVTYDYSKENIGTVFETNENSYLLKVSLFRHPDENADILIRLWEISGENYILTAGPFRWNISSGPQGWLEYELPYPIAIYKNRSYVLSFDTYSDTKLSTEKVTTSALSYDQSGERISAWEKEKSVVPKSVFINTSGRIKVYAILNVKFEPGIIGTDQTICYNTVPNQLTQIQPPTGGAGIYSFQWQSSVNNINWVDIAGGSSAAYTPPALTSNRWFRRVVTSGTFGSVISNAVLITVNPELKAGSIGPSQTICANSIPSTLSLSGNPSGGTGSYTYLWQVSNDNSSWTNIPGAGSPSYSPPALTSTAWFRLIVTSGKCGSITSPSVRILVIEALSAGSVGPDQTICYDTSPSSIIQINAPSGGTGTYTYQWQRSVDNVIWTNISGATLSSYSPSALTVNTWFRRNVTSGVCISLGTPVLITVLPDLTPGAIGVSQSICYNTSPAPLTLITQPAGGTGSYTFQWQSSSNNNSWSNISGANSSSYTPPALISDRYFRLIVTSGNCAAKSTASVRISVNADFTAGTIGSDQSVCYNNAPSVLTQLNPPAGGTGVYTYQWQRSSDNSTWNNISGATASSYSPPALTADTWFRRNVTSGDCGTASSNSVRITVNPALNPGTIGTDQTICFNSAPGTLTQISPPSGGSGTYSFQWQRSTDNSNWTNISGATLSSYSPSALTVNTWFRRNVTSGGCNSTSNTILITVYDELNAGSVGSPQSLCFNTTPSPLTQTAAPSGGVGNYTYQWQSSPNNTSWSDIPGATLSNYSPPTLTSTTWYRRTVTSGSCGSANSPSVRITVYSELSAGTIGTDQSICYNDLPSALSQNSAPSGGTGTYTYQWQRSSDNSTWNNISGATASSYSPPALTADTWFRRNVTSGDCGTASSNSVRITVNPALNPGTIGYSQTICYNSTPSSLNQLTSPSGGSGIYSYQWQRSTDNSTWDNISGAISTSYSPTALTSSTWFRLNVTSANCSGITNSVLITTLGQISQAQLHDSRRISNNTSTNINVTISGGAAPYLINYTLNGTPQTPLTNYMSGTSFPTGILTEGTYVYSLTSVTDANGCYAQNLGTSIIITVLSGEIYTSNSSLVLVNSASSYYSNYLYYIKPYLDNFGIPYEVCDVNSSPLPAFEDYAVLIFGHRNVYSSGYPISQIESAVAGGVGLYSFDPHLFDYSSGFNNLISPVSATSSQVYIPNYSHYITQMHAPDSYNGSNNYVNLRSSWTLTQNSSLAGGSNLATLGSVSLLQVSTYGNGRIVKWSGYDWVFESILGPVYGMDDLIWRGIVWAARKPFVMQGLPPMFTMRVDDVDGTGSEIENNFTWVNICNEFGIIPWLGIFVNNIPSAYIPALRTLINNHQATASPHAYGYALGYNGFIYYNHDNINNFDAAANVRQARDYFINNGLTMSNYVVPHYYEYSSACLAEVRNMGVEFIGVHWLPDLSYTPSPDWLNCGPYRINRNGTSATSDLRPVYYGDYVTLSGVEFFNCITEIRDDGGYEWFPDNSVTTTSNRGVRHLRRAFNSMVLASLFTHEQTYIASITPDNWREILRRVTTGVSGYSPEYTSLDYALRYVRAKKNIRITQVLEKSSTIEIHYSGSNDMNTKCYLFTESGGQIYSSFVELSQINGNNIISVPK